MKKTHIVSVLTLTTILSVIFAESISGKIADVKRIPNGKKFSCENCHGATSKKASAMTPFGIDYKANGKEWTAALAKKDSDGDGISNGIELCDPDGTWKVGDADKSGIVSNPGDPTRKNK